MVNGYSDIEWDIINLLKNVDVLEKYNSKDRSMYKQFDYIYIVLVMRDVLHVK